MKNMKNISPEVLTTRPDELKLMVIPCDIDEKTVAGLIFTQLSKTWPFDVINSDDKEVVECNKPYPFVCIFVGKTFTKVIKVRESLSALMYRWKSHNFGIVIGSMGGNVFDTNSFPIYSGTKVFIFVRQKLINILGERILKDEQERICVEDIITGFKQCGAKVTNSLGNPIT